MDPSCSDLEFFDFKNATEDEIKEIQAILKGPGSNGCVELPWEIPIKENVIEEFSQDAGTDEKVELVVTSKSSKSIETVVSQEQLVTTPQTPLSPPVARLPPPPVEAFVAPPTTIGPYANTPYFVSRTLPYLRAYTHMGVPFFAACPISGGGETNPMNAPYSHFVPVVPATVGQEKFVGPLESESGQKNRVLGERQFNRRSKKKLPNAEYCSTYDSDCADVYREPTLGDEQTPVSPPVSSTVSNDRPTSVPLVPLPVPPPAFGVAGGTLPLHGYPPGLHALPNTQMYGPQAPSAAMYYVPVFNHYGSYLPSPPSAPMVLPVSLRPENETTSEIRAECSEEVIKTANPPPATASTTAKSTENSSNVQSNCEDVVAHEQIIENANSKQVSVSPIAKNTVSEAEEVTDCNSSSDYPLSKSASSSPDCISEIVTIAEDSCKCQPTVENKDINKDSSRCWADLFKKPCPEVNGIDRQFPADQGHENINNYNSDIANGKLHSVPANSNVL
ncbi:uncharacterized protein LOC129223858 [Uloborus diversus]|uniref:uncharacterized protein LOC129223858 n=1 Tax=Uloborus diversus TaxID=327109 RepID=UPI00240A2F32|nr:uncharacterized protein LOC129223858 [Uloborus diversus]